MIKLTISDSQYWVYINPSHIASLIPPSEGNGCQTDVVMASGFIYHVKENVLSIVEMIESHG
jgi:hypothetical protein